MFDKISIPNKNLAQYITQQETKWSDFGGRVYIPDLDR